MRIVNVGYRSVNCFLLVTEEARLLFDVGWPGGMGELKGTLAREGFSIKDVTHAIVSHYHMDHGAIAQEVKGKGAVLIVMESQTAHLNDQREFIRPPSVFHEIGPEGNVVLRFDESRKYLGKLGLDGEIVATPGHCPDHVTLVLDGTGGDRIAFTGDLPPQSGCEEGSGGEADWRRLRAMGVRRVYPAHGRFDLPIDR
jgi:endoribonuclease LACTB2